MIEGFETIKGVLSLQDARVSSTSPVSVKSVSPFRSSLSLAQFPVWLSVHCWSRHKVEMLEPFQCPSCVRVSRLRLSIV